MGVAADALGSGCREEEFAMDAEMLAAHWWALEQRVDAMKEIKSQEARS